MKSIWIAALLVAGITNAHADLVMDLDFQGGPAAGIVVPGVTQAGFTAFNLHNIPSVPDPSPDVNPSITVGRRHLLDYWNRRRVWYSGHRQ